MLIRGKCSVAVLFVNLSNLQLIMICLPFSLKFRASTAFRARLEILRSSAEIPRPRIPSGPKFDPQRRVYNAYSRELKCDLTLAVGLVELQTVCHTWHHDVAREKC